MKQSKFIRFFDKLEDKIRYFLSRRPIIYAFIGGTGIVLFWRGIWYLADDYGLSVWESLIISIIILLLTGTFVSFFIGEQILISGLRQEKRTDEKTKEEIEAERRLIDEVIHQIQEIRQDVKELKAKLIKPEEKRSEGGLDIKN